jgi:co-chaperonin GroES (HSP10)
MNLLCLKDLVLIIPDKLEDKSKGGIHYAPGYYDAAVDWRPYRKRIAEWGTVSVLGPDCKTLKIGQHVYYGDVIGVAFEWQDQEWLSCHEKDVLLCR